MLTPIPLILYLDSAWGFRFQFLIPLVCILSAAEFVLCWTLHFLGIADIHMTLSFTHVVLALSAVILFVHVIRHTFLDTRNKSGGVNAYLMMRTFGLTAISFCTVIDIVRYYYGSGTDSALFVRIGLLIFIICFGCSTLEKTINAVRLGAQTELVSQLAYHDGLTHIGNRTAFEERLAELEQSKDSFAQIGIVMFDVNNLKYVNDNLGHSCGDEMLMQSANIIRSAF
jgi:predicted signal transduction protein with EAL and GGDEF domain